MKYAKGNKINLGRKQSAETIKKRFAWAVGYRHSEETKRKIGLANSKLPHLKGKDHYKWKGGISKQPAYHWRMAGRAYQIRRRGNLGSHTEAQWLALKIAFGFMCLCCKRTEPDIILTRDHVIPLVKGGTDNIDNIQPLCRNCNSQKWAKVVDYRISQHAI